MVEVTCQQCGSSMSKTTKNESNYGVQLLALLGFILGFALLFAFPIGTIVGVILILVTPRLGFNRRKVWKCSGCGYFFDRA